MWKDSHLLLLVEGDRGQETRRKGAGGGRRGGEKRDSQGGGKRGKREKLRSIVQYFAIERMQRGGSLQIQGGNRDLRVREARSLNPPCSPPTPPLSVVEQDG